MTYPGEGINDSYAGASLKEGAYSDIVAERISLMNEKVEIQLDEIIKSYRIKPDQYDPIRDDFVLETEDEYILFSWSTSE